MSAEHLLTALPSVLLVVALWWRTHRVRSAHRRIDVQQAEIDSLKAEIKAIKEANPYMWLVKTAN